MPTVQITKNQPVIGRETDASPASEYSLAESKEAKSRNKNHAVVQKAVIFEGNKIILLNAFFVKRGTQSNPADTRYKIAETVRIDSIPSKSNILNPLDIPKIPSILKVGVKINIIPKRSSPKRPKKRFLIYVNSIPTGAA